jgi:hypothetical protein
MAKAFMKEFIPQDAKVSLYLDEKLSVYTYFKCKKPSLLQALAGISFSKTKETMQKGFSQGSIQGDVNQLGGLFIITPEGKIIYEHLEKFAGDDPNFEDLTKFLKQM